MVVRNSYLLNLKKTYILIYKIFKNGGTDKNQKLTYL